MNEAQLDEAVARELRRFPWLTTFELVGRLQTAGLDATGAEVDASRERLRMGEPSALPSTAEREAPRRRFGIF
ncbi:MAG: hypothetical protein IT307_09125 [Chloroflexi bacterium]|nr:hypothetical protein [Chloroflexota bacterium]